MDYKHITLDDFLVSSRSNTKGIDKFYQDSHELYEYALEGVQERFNNRGNVFGIFEELFNTFDFPNEYIYEFVEGIIFERLNCILQDELKSTYIDRTIYNIDYSKRTIRLYQSESMNEIVTDYSENSNTITINDQFTIKIPTSIEFMREFDVCGIDIYYDTDNTNALEDASAHFWLRDYPTDSTEYIVSEKVDTFLDSDSDRETKEAQLIFKDRMSELHVVVGNYPVCECDDPEIIDKITKFPIDTLEWTYDDGHTDNFMYNTNLISEEELKSQLMEFNGTFNDLQNHEEYGQLAGYPEFAWKGYAEGISSFKSPYLEFCITMYYDCIDGSFNHYDEVQLLEFVPYVVPYDHIDKGVKEAKENKKNILEFCEKYDIDLEYEEPYVFESEDLPKTFEDLWYPEQH